MSEQIRLRVAGGQAPAQRSEQSGLARLPHEWELWCKERGLPRFRADQVFGWLHRKRCFDVEKMRNLPLALREELAKEGLRLPVAEESVVRSKDGTRKLLLALLDGRRVECVLIPRQAQDAEEDEELADTDRRRPVTLCVSTQVGCAMGCVFCASGQAGLKRALGAHEVIAQVYTAFAHLDTGERLSNLVFMGMGEPLHHYDETARAIRLLTHEKGLDMSPRRITVSTVGLPRGIRKLGEDFDGKVGLAVSLHAPDSDTRDQIIPMNRHHPLPKLMAELQAYPLPKRRRITIEYTLIEGLNDSLDHARRLVKTLGDLPVKVNLIPMNSIAASELKGPEPGAVEAFRGELSRFRISCSVRQTRGDDVDAACGQLALNTGG